MLENEYVKFYKILQRHNMSSEVLEIIQKEQTIDVVIESTNIDLQLNEETINVTMLEKWPKGDDWEVTLAWVQTLTNKRIIPRINSISSSWTVIPTGDVSDLYSIDALATNATIWEPTWTPVDWQRLTIRIKDNWTARTLTRDSIYREFATLPLVTVENKTIYVWMFYNMNDVKWDIVSIIQEK